jgi:hypothetical protein
MFLVLHFRGAVFPRSRAKDKYHDDCTGTTVRGDDRHRFYSDCSSRNATWLVQRRSIDRINGQIGNLRMSVRELSFSAVDSRDVNGQMG